MRRFYRFVIALLRELSDENAYSRHLAIHGSSHSPHEWRKFHSTRLERKYSRAKCC